MAEIPLRSYLHEIEKHIESGRTDQAISHSRYLLQVYPKCVDAYRLLGKSYLESQRYTDAGDIFQRVLSAVPDDFVSQVGMSIIREDEGNLDEAIWHMERAFEVQPSNNAIQEELRRLYAKRDNVEPPKIRLTRGALARLYYKGELYQQAISEIRSALAENSSRHDLQALLADIYIKINQRVEAADTALEVLRHLPNCMIAIKVMIQVLAGADREEELKNYRLRLAQLDPYTAFTSPETPNVEDVQDNAVRLEKLDWKPDQAGADAATPAWAASLGVDLADLAPSAESTLPDWLDDLSTPTEAAETPEATSSAFAFGEIAAASAAQAEAAQPKVEEDIPDWLREAGWQSSAAEGMTRELHPAAEESESPPVERLEGGIVERDSQLAEAEIPDWLQALKPAGQADDAGPAAEAAASEEDLAPWLDKILPTEPAFTAETPDVIEIGPGDAAQTEPDWLKAVGLGGAEEPVGAESLLESVPDAAVAAEFAGLFNEETPMEAPLAEETPAVEPVPAEDLFAEPEAAEPLPFWLEEPEIPVEEAPSLEAEMAPGIPDWLTEPAAEETPPAEPAQEFTFETEAEISADLPDWLTEPAAEEASSAEPAQEFTFETEAAVPADLPDWLLEAQEEALDLSAAAPEPAAGETQAERIDLPDWNLAADFADEKIEPLEFEAKDQFDAEAGVEVPPWLRAAQFSAFDETSEEALPAAEFPDWLIDQEPTPIEESPAAEFEFQPEKDEGALPDWLMESSPEEAEPAETAPESAELPSWLFDLESELPDEAVPEEAAVEAAPEAEIELPDWLTETEAETPIVEVEEGIAQAAVEADYEAEIELPDWLTATEAEVPIAEVEEGIQEAAMELPDWLTETEAETQLPAEGEYIQEVVLEETAAPEPEKEAQLDEAFAWLMGLTAAAETPSPAETLEEPASEAVEAEEAPPTTPIGRAAAVEAPEPEEAAPLETLIEAAPEAAEPEAALAEEPAAETLPSPAGEEIMDEDAAFAWLESLAVKQGASEALLLTPEERSESMPDWLQQDVLAAETAAEEIEASAEEEPSQPFEFIEQVEAVQEEIPTTVAFAGEIPAEQALEFAAETPTVEAFEIEEEPPAVEAFEEEIPAEQTFEFAAETPTIEVFELEEELPAVEALEEEIPAEQTFEFEAETPTIEAFEFAEEPPAEALEEIETVEMITAAAPELEAPPAEPEIPELPEWMAETAAAPVEEIEWSPPPVPARRYDLNEASLSDLERLPGIGFITAQTILNYRNENGLFQSVDELLQIPGVGAAALAEARDYLYVTPAEPAAPEAEAPAAPAVEEAFVPAAADQPVSSELEAARLALSQGDLQPALEKYSALIQTDQELEAIAADLQQAANRFPADSGLWQALGDAYLRLEQVQAALEAYVKAEQLLS